MSTRRADLHVHTLHSDGQLSPRDVVRLAREHGIDSVAVTDHDTIDGFNEAVAAGAESGVEIVPGVELSVTVGDEEIHLLGYFFDPTDSDLLRHLARFRQNRYERAVSMVERLRAAGAPISLEAVLAHAQGGAVGRPHVAAALVDAGYVATHQEAFHRYIGSTGAAFVAKVHFPAAEALALLHSAGGVGVLAHPGQWTSAATVQALIRTGLDGVETVHPSHTSWLTAYYERLAQENLLMRTGGSDFHGWRPHDRENLGRYTIPYDQVEAIRRQAA